MKIADVIFKVHVHIEFSRQEVDALMLLSQHHYDSTCRKLSEPGRDAVIYGLTNSFAAGLECASATFTFREIDLMRKCCEIGGLTPVASIAAQLWMQLGSCLHRMNSESASANMKAVHVEVYFDPDGSAGGLTGCYRARLRDNHSVHDAGKTPRAALSNLQRTAKNLGIPEESKIIIELI